MQRFHLVEPKTLHEACVALGVAEDVKVIAGGTALLTLIKQGLLLPKCLVNLKKVPGATEVDFDARSGLRIGALATINEIETSPIVKQHYPALGEACHVVANIRIRNMATIGGNLAHGDYQSDPPTVLAALDAKVEITSQRGTREMPLGEFQRGSYETVLGPGELITAISIPPLPQELKGFYIKFTTGSSEERPCAGIAALARVENRICQELRLAVGAVSQRPVRISPGEEMARGQNLNAELIERIAAEAARVVDPIEDVRGPADYKRHLVQVLTRRAIAATASGSVEVTQ
jgi:carbon-monoxide dehydrogenase medium subunit